MIHDHLVMSIYFIIAVLVALIAIAVGFVFYLYWLDERTRHQERAERATQYIKMHDELVKLEIMAADDPANLALQRVR